MAVPSGPIVLIDEGIYDSLPKMTRTSYNRIQISREKMQNLKPSIANVDLNTAIDLTNSYRFINHADVKHDLVIRSLSACIKGNFEQNIIIKRPATAAIPASEKTTTRRISARPLTAPPFGIDRYNLNERAKSSSTHHNEKMRKMNEIETSKWIEKHCYSQFTLAYGKGSKIKETINWHKKSEPDTPLLPKSKRHRKKVVAQKVGVYEHVTTVNILNKPPIKRTKSDTDKLFSSVKDLKAFSKLSSFVLHELCSAFLYQNLEKDRIVFKQGDQGTCWYVILKGKVDVKISKTGKLDDSKTVVTLESGAGFGDLALVNDKPRSATIITAEPCEFAVVEKYDYNRILKYIHEKECKEKALFMKKLKYFSTWNIETLKSVVDVLKWKQYPKDSVILKEGEISKEIMIIRSGEVQLTKTLEWNGKTLQVPVDKFNEGEMFAEPALKEDEPLAFTLVALTDVEVGAISTQDAMSQFQIQDMNFALHGQYQAHHLVAKQKSIVAQKHLDRFRKSFLQRIDTERYLKADIRNLPVYNSKFPRFNPKTINVAVGGTANPTVNPNANSSATPNTNPNSSSTPGTNANSSATPHPNTNANSSAAPNPNATNSNSNPTAAGNSNSK